MSKKICFYIFLMYSINCFSYILRFKDFLTNDIDNIDVGARFVMNGGQIRDLLVNNIKEKYPNVTLNNLLVFRPDDYKAQEKDRNLRIDDVIDVIAQTNKEPIIYRVKS